MEVELFSIYWYCGIGYNHNSSVWWNFTDPIVEFKVEGSWWSHSRCTNIISIVVFRNYCISCVMEVELFSIYWHCGIGNNHNSSV